MYLLHCICSDDEEDQVAAVTNKSKQVDNTSDMAAAGRETTDSFRKADAAGSEEEDGCSAEKSKKPTTTDERDTKHTKMAGRGVPAQVNTSKTSKKRKHSGRKTLEEFVGGRKTRGEKTYGHVKLSRRKHQALLKLKLKKNVSQARLKSYGLSP